MSPLACTCPLHVLHRDPGQVAAAQELEKLYQKQTRNSLRGIKRKQRLKQGRKTRVTEIPLPCYAGCIRTVQSNAAERDWHRIQAAVRKGNNVP
jgi:hypothetical protein